MLSADGGGRDRLIAVADHGGGSRAPGYRALMRPRERARLTASSRLWTPSLWYRRAARSLAADREMPSLPAMTAKGSDVGRYLKTWASAMVIDAALTRFPASLVASAAVSSAAATVMRDSATDSAATSSAASMVAASSAMASAAAWSAAATMRPAAVSAVTASWAAASSTSPAVINARTASAAAADW